MGRAEIDTRIEVEIEVASDILKILELKILGAPFSFE
mgnify:CR=1 FL=1